MNKTKLILTAVLAVIVVGGGFFAYTTYGSGRLVVELTDPPQNWGPATNIYIRYSGVHVHRANAGNESGWVTVVDSEGVIDLKEALNVSKTIGSGSLQAGKYNLVRFEIVGANVTVEGQNHTASVESGKMTISITQGGVDVRAGQTATLVIDINPKVVGSAASGFKLVPAATAGPSTQ